MTQKEVKLVLTEANNESYTYPVGSVKCDGIAYWSKKKPVTLAGAVSFLRWQAKRIILLDILRCHGLKLHI